MLAVAGFSAPLLLNVYNAQYASGNRGYDAHVEGIQDKVDLRGAARHIGEHWREGDLLAHSNIFTTYPMMYYLPDKRQKHLCETEFQERDFPRGSRNEALFRNHDVLPVQYEKVIPEYERVWLIQADPERRVFGGVPLHEVLARGMTQVDFTDFDGVRVFLFERNADTTAETP